MKHTEIPKYLVETVSTEDMSELLGGFSMLKHVNNGNHCSDINNGNKCDVINHGNNCSVINNHSVCSEINNWGNCSDK